MRKPTVLESVICLTGAFLLAAFVQVRAEQEAQRADGVEAFLEAHAAYVPDGSSGLAGGVALQRPDQALWSEERIAAWSESLAAGGTAPIGVLSIDRLAIEVPVYDGADEHNLNRGVARVRGTARIEGAGNLGIAGHRDGFFRALKDIQHGDLIQLRTPDSMLGYRVVATRVVNPDDVGVLAPTKEQTLTLVTCFPFYFVGHAPQRFIVTAVAQQRPTT